MTHGMRAHGRVRLLNSVSTFALTGSVVTGIFAFLAASATPARAADVVCAPDPSGTAIASAVELCTGPGDKIDYGTFPALVSSTVTLNNVTIPGFAGNAVVLDPGSTASQTMLVTGVGSITATAGDGIHIVPTVGTTAISVGTAANRISDPITGGAGVNTAQGIEIAGRGDVSVFTGNVAISSTSTGGGSWGIRARDVLAGSGPGGAVIVDTLGRVFSGRGGMLVTTAGTDATDSVTVTTAGAVTGNAGTGIQTSSVNGNSILNIGAPVVGSVGVGAGGGINSVVTGSGALSITTSAAGTVNATGVGANGVTASVLSGALALNLNANVSSAAATGVSASATTGATSITIGGSAAITGTIGLSAASTSGAITLLSGAAATGQITGTAGDAVFVSATGTGTVSVGTAANRFNLATTGGNGAAAANGIRAESLGDVNVFTGAVAMKSISTAGASWGIRARSLPGGSGPGGAVVVDARGPVSGPGGIQATTNGTDAGDTVTVVTTSSVTGNAGAGIQARGVNGNVSVTASGAVTGATGTAANGIDVATTGSGNVAITTLAGGTVTANSNTLGVVASAGAGGLNINLGDNVTSTGSNAVKTTSTSAAGVNTITIGAATVRGLGTSTTTAVIDITTATGGLTTLTTGAGTAILSNSATTTAQNGDLALKATGGSVVINNGGSLRGIADFSGISAVGNNVVFNNTSNLSWHTAGTSTFSAGNDVINNTGLIATNGATTLNFGPGADAFNNNNGGTFFIAERPGASQTNLVGLETFANAGTISLADGEGNDVLNAGSTAYTGAGGTIALDAPLASGASQTSCAAGAGQVADCAIFLSTSGTTTLAVTDTTPGSAASLNGNGVVLVKSGSATPTAFVLGGANVIDTPQGKAIQKGFIQYQLVFDAANTAFNLVAIPAASAVGLVNLQSGLQTIWHDTADAWNDRTAVARSGIAPQGTGWSVWAKAFGGHEARHNEQSVTAVGSTFNYDTSSRQSFAGAQVGADVLERQSADDSWVAGAFFGYVGSTMTMKADETEGRFAVVQAGVYASMMSGPVFADLVLKGDFADVKVRGAGGSAIDGGSGRTLGGKATIGTRIAAAGINWDPLASFSAAYSRLGNIANGAASFAFNNTTSLRGEIGIRASTNFADATGMNYEPFVFAGVGDEFGEKNKMQMTSGAQTITFADQPVRTFGLGSVGVNLFGTGAVTGYLKADGLVGSHNARGYALWAGARLAL